MLKPGGKLYFSDGYTDKRVAAELVQNPALQSECLNGALYWNDFENLAKVAGFLDPRPVSESTLTIENPAIENIIGHIGNWSTHYGKFE